MALYTNIKGPINYTVVGSPTIENGIASNFSCYPNSSSYIRVGTYTYTGEANSLEIKVKFKTGDTLGAALISAGGNGTSCVGIRNIQANSVTVQIRRSNNTYIINQSISSEYTFLTNTSYYCLLTFNNNVYSWKIFSENDVLLFSYDYSCEEKINNLRWSLGGSVSDVSYGIWNGSIDLNNSYININGNAWFGTSFSKVKLHSPTAIAYTKKGNPTITDDGVASGFTDKNDYLILGAFNPGTNKWKFTTKVKIYDYATQISLIDRNSSTRCFQIVVRTTGKFRVNISTNGSGKANEVDGTHVVSVNTIYYISFEYDGSKYYLKYSLDNINWVTDITINNSTKIYPVSTMCMGHSWYNSGTEKWNGEIYLRWTRFEINGVTNDKYKLHALEGDYAIVDDRLVWANPNIYLQSSGTQYIDTGLNINNTYNYKIVAKLNDSGISKDGAIWGSRSGAGSSDESVFWYNQYNNKIPCYRFTWFGSVTNLDFIKHIFMWNKDGTFLDNIKLSSAICKNRQASAILFGLSTNNTVDSRRFYGQIYNYSVQTMDGNMLQHLVPVPTGMVIGDFTVPSNGMFDIVNQQFYPNQGTGTFTYGKDE